MFQDEKIFIGMSGEEKLYIYPRMANRHGLIAGATGTGKTVTLRVLAESFSSCGVPVFLADAKGDLAGLCLEGTYEGTVQKRVDQLGLDPQSFFQGFPTTYWDVYQEKGLPLRTTISEMGPLLLSQILDLNETQSDILTVMFKIADDNDLLLIDTKDLKSMISYVGENAKEFSLSYGNIAKQSLAAITRSVIALEAQGGDKFFGEPALDIRDWLTCDASGRGKINILDCQKLMQNPVMYSSFMLWMMSELYETLPECGDLAKPKVVFFFDEAHLLFDHCSKNLLVKVEQVVRLIRSKGVGIYFITQAPADIPDDILAQLGNKMQHGLRAYTPKEQKNAKAAAESFRVNKDLNTYEELINLGIGEALVSVLDESGIPTIVKKASILPPQSKLGVLEDVVRNAQIQNSPLYNRYFESIDSDSAYEFLLRRSQAAAEELERQKAEAEALKEKQRLEKEAAKEAEKAEKEALREQQRLEKEALKEQQRLEKEAAMKNQKLKTEFKKVGRSAAGTIGREVGNAVGSTFGSFGKRLGGNLGASLGRGILNTFYNLKK